MKNGFLSLDINVGLVQVLEQNRIVEPTAIQRQAIPVLLAGNDVIAQAQTGTGKTLAFLLPIMQKINPAENHIQALIVTPTRELALQITQVAKMLALPCGANMLAVYGGQDVEMQKRKLRNSIHIVIGTPGRLVDHLNRKSVNFTRIKTLVLDEADQMLDMGFLRDVERIIHHTAGHRQTLLCSATMPGGIARLAEKYLKSPVNIRVAGKTVTLEKIRQIAVETTDDRKQDTLCALFDEYKPFMAIVFCRTKRRAHALNRMLKARGYASDELHGDLTQGKREKAMKAFRETKIQYLVATDVAARGLDVEGITHIFNYDMPRNAEGYIHRIGRTGRAGQDGLAVTFVSRGDRKALSLIERGIKSTIEIITRGNGTAVNTAVPDKKYTSRYAAKRPYSSNSTDGRTDRGSRKFSGGGRSFPRNRDNSGNDAFRGKGYPPAGKASGRSQEENAGSDNNRSVSHYKYGDRKHLSAKHGAAGRTPDGRKPFSRESGMNTRKDQERNSRLSGGKTIHAKSNGNRNWTNDSANSFSGNRKKRSYQASASGTPARKNSAGFRPKHNQSGTDRKSGK